MEVWDLLPDFSSFSFGDIFSSGGSEAVAAAGIGVADSMRQFRDQTETAVELGQKERENVENQEPAPGSIDQLHAAAVKAATVAGNMQAVIHEASIALETSAKVATTEPEQAKIKELQDKVGQVENSVAVLKALPEMPVEQQRAKLSQELVKLEGIKLPRADMNFKPSNASDMIAWAIDEFIRNLIELLKALFNLLMAMSEKVINYFKNKSGEPTSTMEIAPTDRPQLETKPLESNEAGEATLTDTEKDVVVPDDGGMATVELETENQQPEPEKKAITEQNDGETIEAPAPNIQPENDEGAAVSADTLEVRENTGTAPVEPQSVESKSVESKSEEAAPVAPAEPPNFVAAVPEQEEPVVVPQPSESTLQSPRGDAHDITIHLNAFFKEGKLSEAQIIAFNEFVTNKENAAAIQGALQQEGVQNKVDALLQNNPTLKAFISTPTPVEGTAPVLAAQGVRNTEYAAIELHGTEQDLEAAEQLVAAMDKNVENVGLTNNAQTLDGAGLHGNEQDLEDAEKFVEENFENVGVGSQTRPRTP